jgi:hypothetical protein
MVSAVVLGDSTIDNRVWIGLEKYHLFLSSLGAPALFHQILAGLSYLIPFKAKSVVENLRAQLPEISLVDKTNDGFTTKDVLRGAYKDKVFGFGAHRFFPHEMFKPLECEEIKTADCIILSVGGNNFREFILSALHVPNPEQYILVNYAKVFETLQKDYKEILSKIVTLNPTAKIILMTQYYPALDQKTLVGHSIYDFMALLGKVLNKGNAKDTIVEVMKDTYHGILQYIAADPVLSKRQISVVDVTSSLNPNESGNFVGQIEPSDAGGNMIAQMLSYVIKKTGEADKNRIYRFAPDFFTNQNQAHVFTRVMKPDSIFSPVHPDRMPQMGKFSSFRKESAYDRNAYAFDLVEPSLESETARDKQSGSLLHAYKQAQSSNRALLEEPTLEGSKVQGRQKPKLC